MKRVELVEEGQTYSRMIAGCMRWGLWGAKCDIEGYKNLITAALDSGITTFDHADIYGDYTTEAEFGEALKSSGIKRDSIELITKCGIRILSDNRPQNKIKSYDTSADYIIQSVDQSLKNLKTDYIDLLLIHRPSPLMRGEEIAETFSKLKEDGKVLEFGVSNFSTSEFDLIHDNFELVTNQLELSPMALNLFVDGTITELQAKTIKPQAWSPLGGSAMFSPQSKMGHAERIMRFQDICKTYNWSLSEMALLFLLHHPSCISPVIGTSNPERIELAANALSNQISDEQWFEIWTASTGVKVA